jgi:hypothetical protein
VIRIALREGPIATREDFRLVRTHFCGIDTLRYDRTRRRPATRFEESSERWFAATESYALQLHEIDRDTYLTMKRAEYRRQNL